MEKSKKGEEASISTQVIKLEVLKESLNLLKEDLQLYRAYAAKAHGEHRVHLEQKGVFIAARIEHIENLLSNVLVEFDLGLFSCED